MLIINLIDYELIDMEKLYLKFGFYYSFVDKSKYVKVNFVIEFEFLVYCVGNIVE